MFQYQYGGKKGTTYDLVESQDMVVVRTAEPVNIKSEEAKLSSQSKELVSNMIPVVSFPEASF